MLKVFLLSVFLISTNGFTQTTKPDPTSQINAEEQVNGLPGGASGTTGYSVRTRKKTVTAPAVVAPVENHTPANCADNLGAKGSATFTACEAGKRTR